jgi:hypothetical protein
LFDVVSDAYEDKMPRLGGPMPNSGRLISRIVLAIVWVAVTAGIAFLVARNTEPDAPDTDITADLPPIGTGTRSTVSLSAQTIAPLVTLDGTVVKDGERWLLEAPIAAADLAYRLIDPPTEVKALIDGGPAGFDCPWAGTGQAPDGGVTGRCAIPPEVRVIAGLTGSMVLQLESASTTQTALPVTAVVGSIGQGEVVVVNADGSTSLRTVQLGASDAFWIEITGGLDPSEKVLEFPTQRDFAQAAA